MAAPIEGDWMDKVSRLLELRARIPECKPCRVSCNGGCCGPVPVSETELSRIRGQPIEQVNPEDCVFLDGGMCSIHDERPIICRLYGATSDSEFRCPFGILPDNALTVEESDELIVEYVELTKDEPVYWTAERNIWH